MAAWFSSKKHKDPPPEEEEPFVCVCFQVSEETIRRAIQTQNLKSVVEIMKATGAGRGCGTCREDLEAILKGYLDGETPP